MRKSLYPESANSVNLRSSIT